MKTVIFLLIVISFLFNSCENTLTHVATITYVASRCSGGTYTHPHTEKAVNFSGSSLEITFEEVQRGVYLELCANGSNAYVEIQEFGRKVASGEAINGVACATYKTRNDYK